MHTIASMETNAIELASKDGAQILAQGAGWRIEQTARGLKVHRNWSLGKDDPREWKEFARAFKKYAGKRLDAYPQEKVPPISLPRFFVGLFGVLPTYESKGQFMEAVFEFYFLGKEPAHLAPQSQLFFETCRAYLEKRKTATANPQTL